MSRDRPHLFALINEFTHAMYATPIAPPAQARAVSLRVYHDNNEYHDTQIVLIYHPQYHGFSLGDHRQHGIDAGSYGQTIFDHIGTKQGFSSIGALIDAITDVFPNIYLPISVHYCTIPGDNAPQIYLNYGIDDSNSINIQHNHVHQQIPMYIAKFHDAWCHLLPNLPLPDQHLTPHTPLRDVHDALSASINTIYGGIPTQPQDELRGSSINTQMRTITASIHHVRLSVRIESYDPDPNESRFHLSPLLCINDLHVLQPSQTYHPNHDHRSTIRTIIDVAVDHILHETDWSHHERTTMIRALNEESYHNDIDHELRRLHALYCAHYVRVHVPAKCPYDD